VKIEKVVETVLQAASEEAAEKGVFFNLETGALQGKGDFFIDRDLVAKAIFYVLENSIEAVTQIPMGKKRSVVKVSLFEEGGTIGISVSDRGEGIPKKNLDRIFEPFFSTRPNRVGLGLTFVKRVVEEQGGDIRVESRLKKGTTVTLIFAKDRRRMLRREKLSPEGAGTDNR
jgi:signal transduction histidine kinase